MSHPSSPLPAGPTLGLAKVPRRTSRPASPPAKRVQFGGGVTPWAFVLPQLLVVAVFFYWPSVQAVTSSFYIEDPFGFGATFVGFENYKDVVSGSEYRSIAGFTALFSVVVTALALSIGLLLAVKADKVIRGASAYKTALISVYAIAPPVAGRRCHPHSPSAKGLPDEQDLSQCGRGAGRHRVPDRAVAGAAGGASVSTRKEMKRSCSARSTRSAVQGSAVRSAFLLAAAFTASISAKARRIVAS